MTDRETWNVALNDLRKQAKGQISIYMNQGQIIYITTKIIRTGWQSTESCINGSYAVDDPQ